MGLRKLTEVEYFAYIEDHGHKLRRDEDGGIDIFGLDYENHNGPICVRCLKAWCHHCRDSVERCEKSYTADLPFSPVQNEPA